jgi:hypothetical protein
MPQRAAARQRAVFCPDRVLRRSCRRARPFRPAPGRSFDSRVRRLLSTRLPSRVGDVRRDPQHAVFVDPGTQHRRPRALEASILLTALQPGPKPRRRPFDGANERSVRAPQLEDVAIKERNPHAFPSHCAHPPELAKRLVGSITPARVSKGPNDLAIRTERASRHLRAATSVTTISDVFTLRAWFAHQRLCALP